MEREGTVAKRPPAQSFIIKRPRLTKLLDESEARIILLVAPAGYGKTTLAREWLKGWRGPVAWLSTAPASADVAALSIGIADELDLAQGDTERPTASRLAALTAVQQRPDALARALARSRAEWQPRLVLAIDDYHHLASSPTVEEFVGTLVQLLPATFVITSRSRPSWLAPRFAVYGEAFELGAEELAMRDDEAEEVLRRSKRAHSKSSIELAHGWPAIIGLAAHTEAEDLPDVIPARLYEFLAADLIGAAPPDVQAALSVLALAGVGDIATALDLLGEGSGMAIEDAERRGLLTFGGGGRLTLHPLLSDFLIARLRRQPEKLSKLVDELVPALITSRRWNECLATAEAAPKHFCHFEHVLENALEELLGDGRIATVSRWTELARDAHLDAPIVDLGEGEVALRAGDYDRALALGSRAAHGIAPSELRVRAQLLAARAAHLSDKQPLAKEWFGTAEKGAASSRTRAAAIWGQFLVTYEDESEDLRDALSSYIAAGDGSIEHELRAAQGRMLLAVSERDFAEALDASFSGVALLSLPAEALTRLATLNQHAWILVWAGRYGEALAASDQALGEAELACVDFAVTHYRLTKATALIGLRRFASAQQLLTGLSRQLVEEPNKWALTNLRVAEAKLQLSLGDLPRAASCLAPDPESGQCASQVCEYKGYRGLIAAASGFVDEAHEWAQRAADGSTHIERVAVPAMTRAIIGVRMRDPATISEQVGIALGSGLNDSIVIACRACPELVRHISQTAHRDALIAILSESKDAALAQTAGVRLPRSTGQANSLSPRELEVYELIVQGRTNREISQILFIAESTTKVHVRHILEKLGVRSRVDAVRAWRLDSVQ